MDFHPTKHIKKSIPSFLIPGLLILNFSSNLDYLFSTLLHNNHPGTCYLSTILLLNLMSFFSFMRKDTWEVNILRHYMPKTVFILLSCLISILVGYRIQAGNWRCSSVEKHQILFSLKVLCSRAWGLIIILIFNSFYGIWLHFFLWKCLEPSFYYSYSKISCYALG
jgi:hypothetical protein